MSSLGLLSFISVPILLSLFKSNKKKTINIPNKEYDFIIVGG